MLAQRLDTQQLRRLLREISEHLLEMIEIPQIRRVTRVPLYDGRKIVAVPLPHACHPCPMDCFWISAAQDAFDQLGRDDLCRPDAALQAPGDHRLEQGPGF